ncbi:MAG: ATP-binding protein, partial [Myxococcales bacterium]
YLQKHRIDLVSHLAAQLGVKCTGALDKSMRLVEAIESEANGQCDAFAQTLDTVIAELGNEGERLLELNGAICEMRNALSGHLGREFESVWYSASQRIIAAFSTALFNQRLDLDYSYMHLVGTAEQVSVAFDLTSFEQMLLQHLPRAGVTSTYISRFVDGEKTELEPFVRIYAGKPSTLPICRYPANQLLPPNAYPPDTRFSAVVFPLTCEIQCLGVAIFEYTDTLIGYHLLRDQTSLALQSVLLHRKMVETTLMHERSVQERLSATQRAQALRALAGGVAHDLNNVMGPLVALPDVMLRELAALDVAPEEIRQLVADVESIKTSTRHAVQTIKDLLTLGRNGRTPKVPLDLNATISSWLGLDATRTHLRAQRVRIELDLYPGLLTVVASEAHLLRAIMNLVRNALDAIDRDGQLSIRTYPFSTPEPYHGFESIPAGDYVALSVTDNGKGLPDPVKTRLFEPFFSTKRVGEQCGTGLGLAVVHGVVKEHDGFIDVNSRLGFGTTFTLYLPQSNERITTKTSSYLPRYCHGKILLVDDDPVQRRTGQRVLSHFGYDVDTVASGEDACRRFEETIVPGPCPYDLLILDMQLDGELDGIAVLERVRTRFPSQQAIMVTGQVPVENVERAILRDIPWLQKPYSMDDLGQAVFQALSGQPSVPLVRASTVRP